MKTSMRNLLLNLAAIGLLALFLVWAETNLDGYKVQILNLIAVNAILALSLNLIYGFTGMFSLGHAGFMAIGAYVSALCVLPAAQKEMMWILEDIIWPFSVIHTPFWFSVVEGLEQRRTLPGLETGRQASVHPGEKSARGNGYSDCDEGENELQH